MIEENILTRKKFSGMIEDTVVRTKLSYMDAILHLCEELTLDPLDVGRLVSPLIKDKIEMECVDLNLIKTDTGVLPI